MSSMSRLLRFVDIIRNSGDESVDGEKVFVLRMANGLRILAYCDAFEKEGFAEKIVDALCEEKLLSAALLKREVMKKNYGRGLEFIQMEMNWFPLGNIIVKRRSCLSGVRFFKESRCGEKQPIGCRCCFASILER